jgi:hypothetical protein
LTASTSSYYSQSFPLYLHWIALPPLLLLSLRHCCDVDVAPIIVTFIVVVDISLYRHPLVIIASPQLIVVLSPVMLPLTILRCLRLSSYLIRLVVFILLPVLAVANRPLSWLLFHIIVPSSVRDPPRPFPHPPGCRRPIGGGKALPNPVREAIVIIVVVLDGSASSPSPELHCHHHPWPLGCGGRDGCRGGGMMQPPIVAAFSAYVVVIVLPLRWLNPRCSSCCAPAGLPALPPPPLPHHVHHQLVPTGGCHNGHDGRNDVSPPPLLTH